MKKPTVENAALILHHDNIGNTTHVTVASHDGLRSAGSRETMEKILEAFAFKYKAEKKSPQGGNILAALQRRYSQR